MNKEELRNQLIEMQIVVEDIEYSLSDEELDEEVDFETKESLGIYDDEVVTYRDLLDELRLQIQTLEMLLDE